MGRVYKPRRPISGGRWHSKSSPQSEFRIQSSWRAFDREARALTAREAVAIVPKLCAALYPHSERGQARHPQAMALSPGRPRSDIRCRHSTTFRVQLHRLKKRFREILRHQLAQTLADPTDVDQELAPLLAALRGGAWVL